MSRENYQNSFKVMKVKVSLNKLASIIANAILKELVAHKSDPEFVIPVDDAELQSKDAKTDNEIISKDFKEDKEYFILLID